jgi:hypothetical protein
VIFQTAEPFNESTFLITAKFLVVWHNSNFINM